MILFLVASAGWAQDPPEPLPPAPTDGEARAKVLYDNGAQLYEEGQYEAAVLAFQSALAAWPGATTLHYNLSNCYERLGKLKQAYEELNLYRATAAPEERDTIERRLRALELRMAEAPAPAPAPAPVLAPVPAPPAPVPTQVRSHPRWALVGGGLGALAVGGLGAGLTYSASQNALDENDRPAYDTARTFNGVSFGVGGLGVGLAVLGLAWQTSVSDGATLHWTPTRLSGTW